MKSIEIDDQVFGELARRATVFHVTPNDVLRRILNLVGTGTPQAAIATSQPPASLPMDATLVEFVRSDRFQRHNQAINRLLAILGWLSAAQPKRFADAALSFKRGKRLYFAKCRQEIEQSGDGIIAKAIPQSPLWVLATLDNKSKRIIVEDILNALSYSREDINIILAELPDSDIRRRHSILT